MSTSGREGLCICDRALAAVAPLVLMLVWAGAAQASFPGQNGRIAYVRDQPLLTSNLDGSGEQQLTSGVGVGEPAWSPDGKRIALAVDDIVAGNEEVYVMNADGSAFHDVTNDPANDFDPAWSPSGDQLVFMSSRGGSGRLWLVNADGTATTLLGSGTEPQWSPDGTRIAVRDVGAGISTLKPDGSDRRPLTSGVDLQPNWSPDGTKVVFMRWVLHQPCTRYCDPYISYELWTVNADGTDERRITSPPAGSGDGNPVWSPDGTRILFIHTDGGVRAGLFVINPDGTDVQPVQPGFQGYGVDWQPLPVNSASTHVRPKGATPMRAALVPAFTPCATPDRTHGPPLSFGSCSQPRTVSSQLTIGSSDGGRGFSKSVGSIRFDPVGAPGPPDDTDVSINISVTNVMEASSLADYTGELEGRPVLRITDKDGAVSSTWRDLQLSVPVPCTATADATLGSACSTTASADAVIPGLVVEGSRAVWELGRVQVLDGGGDGAASTSPNSTFLTQGVFVP